MSTDAFYEFMRVMSEIIENLSFYMFCSLVALFIVPQSLYNMLYFLPNMIRFALRKRIEWRGMWHILKELVVWGVFFFVTYLLFIFMSPSITAELYFGMGSILSWVTGLIVLAYNVLFKRHLITDEYYEQLFVRYATGDTLSVYEEFLANLDSLPDEELYTMNRRKLNYLERKALIKRIKQLETKKTEFELEVKQ